MKDPDKEFEKIIEKEKPHHLVYFKVIFLLVIIFMGMGIFKYFSENVNISLKEKKVHSASKTLESIKDLPTQLTKNEIINSFTKELEKNPEAKKILNFKDQILGVASDESGIKEGGIVSNLEDMFYDNTVLNVLQKIISNLPEKQQDRLLEKVK